MTQTDDAPKRFDPTERSRRVQHWHDRGYRLVKATLTIENQEEPTT